MRCGTENESSLTPAGMIDAVVNVLAQFVLAGAGLNIVQDPPGTFTISAEPGGGSTDPEIVRDVIGAALVAGAGIQITVSDAGDTLTIASTAVLPTRSVIAGTGLTGGGDLSADRTFAVAYGTTAGTAAEGNHTHDYAPALGADDPAVIGAAVQDWITAHSEVVLPPAALAEHVAAATPHPAYDVDMQDLAILYTSRTV